MPTHPHHELDLWQYRLSETHSLRAQQVGRFWLTLGADLPVTRVTDNNGADIGVILGFAIDIPNSMTLGSTWAAPVDANDPIETIADALLWVLGGRYIWICTVGNHARIYPDAGAQVTCVYDPIEKCVGATAPSILDGDRYEARFNRSLFETLGVNGEGWFPAGLTAHYGLFRLLPNHYLDLNTWTTSRFSLGAMVRQDLTPDDIVGQMIDVIQSQIAALAASDRMPAIALTAGYETRVLLACARPFLDKVKFVTVVGEDRHQIDSIIAGRIATDLALDYMPLHRKEADADQQALFLRRGGHCHGDSNIKYHPSVWPLVPDHVFVGGLGGEIGRAFLWRASDTSETEITPDFLISRFGLPTSSEATTAIDAWLAVVKNNVGKDALQILDLAYIENRMGPWANAQFCADPTVIRHAPMFTYATSQLMRNLPADWKISGKLGIAIINQLWPELSAYPYNSLGPTRDLWVKVQRIVANPTIIFKKLRQMHG
jgi:hypothetical protein